MKSKRREMLIKEMKELGRQLDYDEAMARLHKAGLADEFLRAISRKPELMEAIKKVAPAMSARRAVADWSCCITVDKPITTSW